MSGRARRRVLTASVLLVATGFVAGAWGTERELEQREAALGRELFFDKRMSKDGKVACTTCHRPERAYSGPIAMPTGVYGRKMTRNPVSLGDEARPKHLLWDGRSDDLEAVAFGAFLVPEEFGNESAEEVVELVVKNHSGAFEEAFPKAPVTASRIGRALTTFLRSLHADDSPFDRFQAGDTRALSDSQRRGYKIFVGPGDCSRCHVIEPSHATFSDGQAHWGDISMELKPKLPQLAEEMAKLDERARMSAMATRPEVSALGRYLVSLAPEDIGRFVTPNLRNVALTAPYMHDGNVQTLGEAVEREVYYRARENTTLGKLTPTERADIVAFLESLTSHSMTEHFSETNIGPKP